LFKQTRGALNQGNNCVIEFNNLSVPSGMGFLNTDVNAVWGANVPLFIRYNTNHASMSPVIVTKTYAVSATGVDTITAGFRPSSVHVYVTADTTDLAAGAVGVFSWNATATRNDFSMIITSTSGTGQRVYINNTDVARVVNAGNTTLFLMEFTQWTETGFFVNVITANQAVTFRFVCYP
jgi:hypothetical protein